jgi:hypothetical protein
MIAIIDPGSLVHNVNSTPSECTDFAKQILVDYARLLDQSAPMEDYSPWWLGCRSCDISMGVVVAPRLGFQS